VILRIGTLLKSDISVFFLTFFGTTCTLHGYELPHVLMLSILTITDSKTLTALLGLSLTFAFLSLANFKYAHPEKKNTKDRYWHLSNYFAAIFFGVLTAQIFYRVDIFNVVQVNIALFAFFYFLLCFSVRELARKLWIKSLQHDDRSHYLAYTFSAAILVTTTYDYFNFAEPI